MLSMFSNGKQTKKSKSSDCCLNLDTQNSNVIIFQYSNCIWKIINTLRRKDHYRNAYEFTIFGLIIPNEPKHNLANQTWQLIFTTVFINIINGRCRLHFSQHDMSAIMTSLLLQKQKLQRHIKPNLIIQINMMIL